MAGSTSCPSTAHDTQGSPPPPQAGRICMMVPPSTSSSSGVLPTTLRPHKRGSAAAAAWRGQHHHPSSPAGRLEEDLCPWHWASMAAWPGEAAHHNGTSGDAALRPAPASTCMPNYAWRWRQRQPYGSTNTTHPLGTPGHGPCCCTAPQHGEGGAPHHRSIGVDTRSGLFCKSAIFGNIFHFTQPPEK